MIDKAEISGRTTPGFYPARGARAELCYALKMAQIPLGGLGTDPGNYAPRNPGASPTRT